MFSFRRLRWPTSYRSSLRTRAKLGIVQQQVSKFRARLNKIKLCHPFRFTLKLRGRNADQFAEHVSGVVEGQGLIEIAGKKVAFQELIAHGLIRFARPTDSQQKTWAAAIPALDGSEF